MGWNGMGWDGIGLDWIGLDCIGLDWIALMGWNGMMCGGMGLGCIALPCLALPCLASSFSIPLQASPPLSSTSRYPPTTATNRLFCISCPPQMDQAATGGNICRFVMQSYQRFGQAFFCDAFDQPAQIEDCPEEGAAALPPASVDDSSFGVAGYGRRYSNTSSNSNASSVTSSFTSNSSSIIAKSSSGSDGSVVLGGGGEGGSVVAMSGHRAMQPPTGSENMKNMMEQAMPEYERLEETVDG